MAAKLDKLPVPPAETVAANRARFMEVGATVEAQVEKIFEELESEGGRGKTGVPAAAEEVVGNAIERGAALEKTFELFGFENE